MSEENNGEPNNIRHPTCAPCKHQRRKCPADCVMAPYFSAQNQTEFVAVHKIFGVCNVSKMLRRLDNVQQRDEAAKSIKWEASEWERNPVLGPLGAYEKLRVENEVLVKQLEEQKKEFEKDQNEQRGLLTETLFDQQNTRPTIQIAGNGVAHEQCSSSNHINDFGYQLDGIGVAASSGSGTNNGNSALPPSSSNNLRAPTYPYSMVQRTPITQGRNFQPRYPPVIIRAQENGQYNGGSSLQGYPHVQQTQLVRGSQASGINGDIYGTTFQGGFGGQGLGNGNGVGNYGNQISRQGRPAAANSFDPGRTVQGQHISNQPDYIDMDSLWT